MYATEQEAHNKAKTQRPLADLAAGGDRLNPQLREGVERCRVNICNALTR
jgi:hypothetical protein